MNLFTKYGIKEVADVTLYSIIRIEDEEFYIPVLYLDTLKVSTVEEKSSESTARGGKNNRKIIGWNFNKDITLKLEDALLTPASMNLMWGGNFGAKLSLYTETIIKCNIANKYKHLNYSIKAKPSPILTLEAWELIFKHAEKVNKINYIYKDIVEFSDKYVAQNRQNLINRYYSRNTISEDIISNDIINSIAQEIDNLSKISFLDMDTHNPSYIDRMEKCVVKEKEGLEIDAEQQHKNIISYYKKEVDHNYTIFYDPKTMLPLFHLNNTDGNFNYLNDDNTSKIFKIKQGTIYYKWTRTIQPKAKDVTIGREIIIDTNSFPGEYKIVGETYIREQKTGKDERYQFIVNCAKLKTNSTVELKADGDPVVFSLEAEVFNRHNKDMIQLCQYDVEEDNAEGGFRIVPQKSKYTYTPTNIEFIESININNEEIY